MNETKSYSRGEGGGLNLNETLSHSNGQFAFDHGPKTCTTVNTLEWYSKLTILLFVFKQISGIFNIPFWITNDNYASFDVPSSWLMWLTPGIPLNEELNMD